MYTVSADVFSRNFILRLKQPALGHSGECLITDYVYPVLIGLHAAALSQNTHTPVQE